jgi:hypothetical protein
MRSHNGSIDTTHPPPFKEQKRYIFSFLVGGVLCELSLGLALKSPILVWGWNKNKKKILLVVIEIPPYPPATVYNLY